MRIDNLRVLIIDGHLAIGRGLKALIEEIPGLCVVGLATRGDRGLKQAALTVPDVALVDADLPGLCSAAVIRLLRWRQPTVRVIALGIYPERRRAALLAGAHAFVLKDAGYDALRAAIAGESETGELGTGETETGEPEAVEVENTIAGAVGRQPTGVATGAGEPAVVGGEERVLSCR
jgi:DNA-binding response OmpR family regulator